MACDADREQRRIVGQRVVKAGPKIALTTSLVFLNKGLILALADTFAKRIAATPPAVAEQQTLIGL